MKKFLIFALISCFFLKPLHTAAQEMSHNVILELEHGEPDYTQPTLNERVKSLTEIAKYFETNYPDEKINEDLSDDLAKFFPKMEKQKLFNRANDIRTGIKLYRYGKNLFEEIKEKYLTPSAPPLLLSDDEYDSPYTAEYIEVKDNEVVIIQDFKKVLSYGSDIRDYESYQEKLKRDAKKQSNLNKSAFQKISEMLSKIEIKKLPFYGIYYESPFTGFAGQGAWAKAGALQVRLTTEMSAVNYQTGLKGAIQLLIPSDKYVLAINGGQGLKRPQYDFSKSKNLKSYEIFSPKPSKYIENDHGTLAVYQGNIGIPFIIKPKNVEKPVFLKANIRLNLCDEYVCEEKTISPELTLVEGEGMGGTMSFFVNQAFMQLPQVGSNSVVLKSLVIEHPEEDGGKQTLKASLKVKRNIERIEIYVDSAEGIAFSRPRISINSKNVVARFETVEEGIDLRGREFAIITSVNGVDVVKEFATATEDSLFDIMSKRLSLTLILFGVLGGLILNLMPCVFPVLSIKLLAMSNIGAKKNNRLKKDFWLTTLGIFASFILIAVILSTLKNVGVAIGWGMQFQNPLFLVFMSFIMVLFIAHIIGLVNISLPIKDAAKDKDGLLSFFSGTVVVLMATPCTAPYLGTAIGFALAGSTLDIFSIMLSVAFGLSLPYILIAIIPNFALYLPKPGPWMEKLTKIMVLMLFLTIIWLLWVLAAQTSVAVSARIFIYLLVFMAILLIRRLFIDTAMSDSDIEGRNRFLKKFKLVVLALMLSLFGIACWDAGYHFTKYRNVNLMGKAQTIDEEHIKKQVKKGRTVLLTVGANWCLTCGFNNFVVFENPSIKQLIKERNIEVIHIDWTNYDPEVLAFMEKFGRKGLPFYIIFSPNVPDGMVLPELLNDVEMYTILSGTGF